eukprot:4685428-Amphidinium_carterae.1
MPRSAWCNKTRSPPRLLKFGLTQDKSILQAEYPVLKEKLSNRLAPMAPFRKRMPKIFSIPLPQGSIQNVFKFLEIPLCVGLAMLFTRLRMSLR